MQLLGHPAGRRSGFHGKHLSQDTRHSLPRAVTILPQYCTLHCETPTSAREKAVRERHAAGRQDEGNVLQQPAVVQTQRRCDRSAHKVDLWLKACSGPLGMKAASAKRPQSSRPSNVQDLHILQPLRLHMSGKKRTKLGSPGKAVISSTMRIVAVHPGTVPAF